jgi:uncharacterized protein YjdB
MKRLLLPIPVLLLTTFLSAQVPDRKEDSNFVATETRIAKQSTTETGDRGLFTVPSVETLNKNQFSYGFGWTNVNRSPRDLNVSSFPVFLSYGLLGRLTLTGSFDTNRQLSAHNLTQPGFNNAFPFVNQRFAKGLGDSLFAAKYRFRRLKDNVGGISFRTFAKVGTAEANKGLGTGNTDVGVDGIFSSTLPLRFTLDSSIGFTSIGDAKDPVTGGTRKLKNEMRSGLGTAWPAEGIKAFKGSLLQGIFEYATVTYVGGGSANAGRAVQNVSDIAAGLRFMTLNSGITLNAGYRNNTKLDLSFPGNERRNSFTFSFSYTKPVRSPGNNHFPNISLETSSDDVAVGGTVTITATGYDADNDPLTYSWTSSGGKIVGSGDKATFNAAGLTSGRYTVRATASDGRGGTASALIQLTVKP